MTQRVLPSPDEVRALVPEPGSVTWRRASDLRLMASAGYALVLQVAHPTVGAGVAQYSRFAEDPWGRLFRTLDYVNGTIYGGAELAGEIGRRVRRMHRTLNGTRTDGSAYRALEPEAYAWVHATLASSIVEGHRLFGSPLNPEEQVELWEEWRRLGRLIGVRDGDLPERWEDYGAYFEHTVEHVLEDSPTVHDVLRALTRPTVAPPGMPKAAWLAIAPLAGAQIGVATVGLLPSALRRRLGLRWTPVHELALHTLGTAMRATSPLLPRGLRESGPAYLRWRQVA